MQLQITKYQPTDFEAIYALSRKLYPNYEDHELRRDLLRFTQSERQQVFMAKSKESFIGFIMVSARIDYVEGASSSPTGYLEAIFIEAENRGKGFSKQLLQVAENWVKQNGCTEMGSDTWLNHQNSINFHRAMGFEEEDRLVHFIKKL